MNICTFHSLNYISLGAGESKELTTEVAAVPYGSGYKICLLSLFSPTSNTSALYLIAPDKVNTTSLSTNKITLTKNGKTVTITNNESSNYNWFYSMLHF